MDAEALPLAEADAEGCALAVGGWALADAAALGSAVGSVPESADGSVLDDVSLAAAESPSTTSWPVVAPESPPNTWFRASFSVSAKPILSPKETSTLRSSGYCVPEDDWTYTGWT